MSNLLDYREAAQILRRSPATLRKDVMLGRVPHLKMFGPKGRVLFEREALEQLIAQSRVATIVPPGGTKQVLSRRARPVPPLGAG